MKASRPDSHAVRTLSKDRRSFISTFINLCLIAGTFFVSMIGLFGRPFRIWYLDFFL